MNPITNEQEHDSELGNLFERADNLVHTDPQQLLTSADEMIATIDARGSMDERLRIRRTVSLAYARTNRFDRALAIAEEALALDVEKESPLERARVTMAFMEPLANLNRIDDAIAAGKSALATFDSLGETELAGRSAVNIGAIYAMAGVPVEALAHFDRASEYLSGPPVLLGQIEINRGTALATLDRFGDAETAFERAGRVFDSEEDSVWHAAIVEGNLAYLAARQGEINRSLRHYERARRRLEIDSAKSDLGRINAEEGAVLAAAGLTAVARETFADSLQLLEEHGTPLDLATARISYARVLVEENDLTAAEAVLSGVRDMIDPDEDSELYLQLLSLRAKLAITDRDNELAESLISEGLTRIGDRPMQRLRWNVLLAEAAREHGEIDRALEILERSLADSRYHRINPLTTMLHETLASMYRSQGDHDTANLHARKAIEAAEDIRGTIQADRVRESWHRDRLQVYEDLYLALLSNPDADHQAEAFGVAERIRSRTLFDKMQRRSFDSIASEDKSSADVALAGERDDHRRWLNWMYSSIAEGNEPTEEQLLELRERERALSQLEDRLALLQHHAGFHTPITVAEVHRKIAKTDVVVSYLMLGDRLTVQVIDGQSVHGVDHLATEAEISRLVATLQFQVSRALAHGNSTMSEGRQRRLQRDIESVLRDLHELLIAPIAHLLGNFERIAFIPSGPLYGVPFSALYDGTTYLIDHFEVAIGPGVSILNDMELAGTVKTNPSHPLIVSFGDVIAPGLDIEADRIAARFPAAAVLSGEEAEAGAVTAAMREADLIHLACHGRFDSVHPRASGIRLSDGWLTLNRLMENRLNSPLVMLTGCETGRVRVERGDDVIGMIVAFVAAGAAGMVTSLWKTHDSAATRTMEAFYQSLEKLNDPVSALRTAQLHVRDAHPHPAFWAPFVGVFVREKGAT